jgi:hypothetical protein
MHQQIAPQAPQEAQKAQGRELPHERAARLLACWDRHMDAGNYEAARRWMLTLDDPDCDLFLEAHGERMRARELSGVDFFD